MELSTESVRIFFASFFATILAYFEPTNNFMWALVVAFGVNLFAGMRADGVSISRCKNFSFRKFKDALLELLLIFLLIHSIHVCIKLHGDAEAAFIALKTLNYIVCYCYIGNGLKNLVKAYPTNVKLRIIYHIWRVEFKKAAPERVKTIIERFEKDEKQNTNENETF